VNDVNSIFKSFAGLSSSSSSSSSKKRKEKRQHYQIAGSP
jgi:hypothetical protein